jgi:NADH:ubiquinone oxidoreductase subunit 5 (subunit L)/multisubunit Na+/H+ antiporter MnhA subunit
MNVDLVLLLVIVAASVKGASYCFSGWLLDAMEGPTPVSSLLHSATLVTAGVVVVMHESI